MVDGSYKLLPFFKNDDYSISLFRGSEFFCQVRMNLRVEHTGDLSAPLSAKMDALLGSSWKSAVKPLSLPQEKATKTV